MEQKKCLQCGLLNDQTAHFCNHCGHKFQTIELTPQPNVANIISTTRIIRIILNMAIGGLFGCIALLPFFLYVSPFLSSAGGTVVPLFLASGMLAGASGTYVNRPIDKKEQLVWGCMTGVIIGIFAALSLVFLYTPAQILASAIPSVLVGTAVASMVGASHNVQNRVLAGFLGCLVYMICETVLLFDLSAIYELLFGLFIYLPLGGIFGLILNTIGRILPAKDYPDDRLLRGAIGSAFSVAVLMLFFN